jgi:hypothetical protein
VTWSLPPADHPIWALLRDGLQLWRAIVGVVFVITLGLHGAEGFHHGGIDLDDVLGAGGALSLVHQLWTRRKPSHS